WRGLPAPRDGEGLRRCVSVGLRAGGASGPGGESGVGKERVASRPREGVEEERKNAGLFYFYFLRRK
ncbi:MAG: hypothetical protein GX589_08690, partial [Deltaproteobacteria bacterium]|nr:hypothetical protein [Deltaproteobacteria bacterium]